MRFLIKGFSGAANVDGDSYVSVVELFKLVGKLAARITEGHQHPYSRKRALICLSPRSPSSNQALLELNANLRTLSVKTKPMHQGSHSELHSCHSNHLENSKLLQYANDNLM